MGEILINIQLKASFNEKDYDAIIRRAKEYLSLFSNEIVDTSILAKNATVNDAVIKITIDGIDSFSSYDAATGLFTICNKFPEEPEVTQKVKADVSETVSSLNNEERAYILSAPSKLKKKKATSNTIMVDAGTGLVQFDNFISSGTLVDLRERSARISSINEQDPSFSTTWTTTNS